MIRAIPITGIYRHKIYLSISIPFTYFQLQKLQEVEGLNLGNKLSSNHLKFQKHKMNVRLAAQTLSLSVANAIEFLDKSSQLPTFCYSHGTVKFIRTIDRVFYMLNSRNPIAKGFKTPLRPNSKDTWEEIFMSTANYLLSLKTHTPEVQASYFPPLNVKLS